MSGPRGRFFAALRMTLASIVRRSKRGYWGSFILLPATAGLGQLISEPPATLMDKPVR